MKTTNSNQYLPYIAKLPGATEFKIDKGLNMKRINKELKILNAIVMIYTGIVTSMFYNLLEWQSYALIIPMGIGIVYIIDHIKDHENPL